MCWKCDYVGFKILFAPEFLAVDSRQRDNMGVKLRRELDSKYEEHVIPDELVTEMDEVYANLGGRAAFRHFKNRMLGPARLTPLALMMQDMAELGLFIRLVDDEKAGFNNRGVNSGWRAHILFDAESEPTKYSTLYYIKQNENESVAQAEVAAYMLSEVTGAKLVPYTFRHGVFSFHEWQHDTQTANNAGYLPKGRLQHRITTMHWFDFLIMNVDRHGGNWLIRDDATDIFAIDNGYSMGSRSQTEYSCSDYDVSAPAYEGEYPFWMVDPRVMQDALAEYPEIDGDAVLRRHWAALDDWRTRYSQLSFNFAA